MNTEFKGTKGKWIFGGNTIEGVLISSTHPQNRDICTVWAYDVDFLEQQEMKANALLISKAPELLAKLQYLYSMDLLKDDEESVLKLINDSINLDV